jgi:hypothetical protein
MVTKHCEYCGRETKNLHFCSSSCSGPANSKARSKPRDTENCMACGKSLEGKPRESKSCSKKCDGVYKRSLFLNSWYSGKITGGKPSGELSTVIRNHLFELHGSKCEKCNWGEKNKFSGKVPLTVNHIDGNPENHSPTNLELICPNCHSLTPNYGALNKGNGRKQRYAALVHK